MEPGRDTVFALWCRLTGTDADDFSAEERRSFLRRPQVEALAETPYEQLLAAGIDAARGGSLPLEHWLRAVEDGSQHPPVTA